MIHHIVRLPAESVEAQMALARAGDGADVEQRLAQALPPSGVPHATALVLIWCGEPLSAPDSVTLCEADWEGRRLKLRIELRFFDGPLHMNVLTVPVIEIELGALAAGDYEIDAMVERLAFGDLDHPEIAAPAGTERQRLPFSVA